MKLSKKISLTHEQRNRIMGIVLGAFIAVFMGIIAHDGTDNVFIVGKVHDQLKAFEYRAYDMRFRLRGALDRKLIPDKLVLLDIDDESYEWKPWPYDRTLYAEIIKALGEKGSRTKATFFDVFFFDPAGPALNVEMADVFRAQFENLVSGYQANQQAIGNLKTALYDISASLKTPGSAATLKSAASGLLKAIGDQQLVTSLDALKSTGAFLSENADLATLAPDRDKILHDAIAIAGNVYLAQIVNNKEDTPYGFNDILYNKKAHEIFARLIVLADRTQTKNQTEVLVNFALRNLSPEELQQLLDSSKKKEINGGKPLPFTKKQRAAISAEIKKLKTQNDKALAINGKLGITPRGKPAEIKELLRSYMNVINMQTPIPEVGEYVAGVGYVKPEFQKQDGTVRSAAPAVVFEGKLYLHIDLIIAMRYLDIGMKDLRFEKERIILNNCKVPHEKKRRKIIIPLYEGDKVLVNWAGQFNNPRQFSHRSFKQIYDASVIYNLMKKQERGEPMSLLEQQRLASFNKEEKADAVKTLRFFDGKISMTGMTAADTHDLNPTPLDPRYPLVGMHVNFVNTIVNELFIKVVSFWSFFVVLVIICVGIGYAGGAAKQAIGALITFGAVAGYFIATVIAFSFNRLWIPLVPAIIAIILTYLMVIV
ncbi:MAG TPA: CHASE2 domain-containing protein, partial [bacterium]|nr:CHASE2 domain-containing protein [bacterium]